MLLPVKLLCVCIVPGRQIGGTNGGLPFPRPRQTLLINLDSEVAEAGDSLRTLLTAGPWTAPSNC